MTNLQEARDRMFRNIIGISDENPILTENLPDYTTNLGNLKTVVSELRVAAEEQKIDTKGVTRYKLQLRNQLNTLGADNARKLTAYARLTNNQELLGKANYCASDFVRSIDYSIKDYAEIIYDCAEPIIDQLARFGITAATQSEFRSAIDEYFDAMASPALVKINRIQATEKIVKLIDTGNTCVANMAAAVETIRLSEPIFYLGFKTAQKVTVRGRVKLSVKGQTFDANDEPLPRVTMTVTLNGAIVLVKKTSANGGFNIKSLPTGTYQFTFKKAGYGDQTVVVNVNDGEMTRVKVKMINV
ncbi:MAG: carboxypeptidase-like regulatory domain-containing protein [Bacteroidia bacterium]|nr:carboxypeptidase-like regulatory domain-containing protein [Bacteroidia bacterium]